MSALDPAAARRFMLRAQRLDAGIASVAEAIAHMGFVQMDPVNVCGRMHDLILRNRVHGYAEHDLLRHVYPDAGAGPRRAFEHFLPGQGILVSFPLSAWPFLVPHMRQRAGTERGFNGKLPAAERAIARRILAEIGSRGALSGADIEHGERTLSAWGTAGRTVKVVLEKLLVHGEVLIAARRNFRRIYDLPERVLAPATLNAPAATPEESLRWRLVQRLKQRRLARLSRADASSIGDLITPVPVRGGPALYCLREDAPLLDAALAAHAVEAPPRLLAPLDPLIYDRALTARLWDYAYTWEVYTPPARRVRGYYALPLLAGDALVGHVDPKADRAARSLRVMGRQVRRGHRSAAAVRELARFLGLKAP